MAGSALALLGTVLLFVGLVVAALTFVFLLLDLTGDFPARVIRINGATSLVFVLGGALLRMAPRSA